MRRKSEIVTVKMQRPIATNGSYSDVLSYIVDEDDEQASNPVVESLGQSEVEHLFGEHYKIYYTAEYRKNRKLQLVSPTRQEDWV